MQIEVFHNAREGQSEIIGQGTNVWRVSSRWQINEWLGKGSVSNQQNYKIRLLAPWLVC